MKNMRSSYHWINSRWLLISLMVILLDQLTKSWVVAHLIPFQPFTIFSFFDLLLSFNTGAAWSFLDHAGGWQQWLFGGIAGVVSLLIILFLFRQNPRQILAAVSLSFILGGALGNLYDRITRGYVVDFLHFHLHDWSFAIFNIADTAITIGAGLMVIDLFLSRSDR